MPGRPQPVRLTGRHPRSGRGPRRGWAGIADGVLVAVLWILAAAAGVTLVLGVMVVIRR